LFDKRVSRFLSEFKNQLMLTCANYLKAYLFLMLLSFTQLYLGLTVLRVNYAFSVALFIAVVDILPVLGMGVIVIPWALWCFLTGNLPLGGGLMLLYGLMSIVRQIAEPKVVGNFIGLHPLASLLSVCVGLRFLGVGGMFALPMLVIVLKNMIKSGHLRLMQVGMTNTPSL
jgi:sporulation integral membrane protein YtvI